MNDDLEIPEVFITDDWAVSDLETVEDCEDAYILLMTACAHIDGKLDDMENGVCDRESMGRTRAALKWKKLALNLVNLKKSRFSRILKEGRELERERSRDGLMLSFIASENPEQLRLAGIWADGVLARKRAEAA